MTALLLFGGIILYVIVEKHEPLLEYNKIMFCCPGIAV
jgi:hypothetical protein